MKPPTARQIEVLEYIHSCGRVPPTMRELGEALGIKSTNAVNDLLKYLEKKQCIVRDSMLSRSVRVTDVGMQYLPKRPSRAPAFIVHIVRCVNCHAARAGAGVCPMCGAAGGDNRGER